MISYTKRMRQPLKISWVISVVSKSARSLRCVACCTSGAACVSRCCLSSCYWAEGRSKQMLFCNKCELRFFCKVQSVGMVGGNVTINPHRWRLAVGVFLGFEILLVLGSGTMMRCRNTKKVCSSEALTPTMLNIRSFWLLRSFGGCY